MNSLPLSSTPKNLGTDFENSTIQRQRKELQLLIAELKDRDKELNDMVAVHQRQLVAWDEDRQKVLNLEERSSRLENELHKRDDIIKTLTKRIQVLESRQRGGQAILENTQQQLHELSQKELEASSHRQDLEEKNQALSVSTLELSALVGQLQAREQELRTMLHLKDKDIIEATNHITEFTTRFKKLEAALRESRVAETNANKELQELNLRLKGLKCEINKLKDELSQKTVENNEQREEIIRLKQENSCIQRELELSVESEKRKDQLLELAKSKQDRTDAELHALRKIYVKQQHDMQFLHLNLESSQELIHKHERALQDLSADSLDLASLSLGAPLCCNSSLQKKKEQEDSTDFSLDLNVCPLMQSTHRDFKTATSQETCSPTVKLQRLLAESRQMVSDLELSTLLPIGSGGSSGGSGDRMTPEASNKIELPDVRKDETRPLAVSL
uniref:Coiled-coil domain-containing protein 62 n=1 Tax=Geotrypetes seraphini TaxID=260995 RepID=A0A6P8S1D0_GEOSA|nr:coiled-coil domain-containing protein 62 [Geotrypetes seraphini]XP_033811618.1 coiled-coil domain-containing protein 62 [Geotrypetes seraphini]XP_033811619.1 coiled-coil domain-containing protein 62 [Geotrypetes seraphini]